MAASGLTGLPQLREVPLTVLGRLKPVPAAFLKQLATDKELFHELPQNVQQEVCANSAFLDVYPVGWSTGCFLHFGSILKELAKEEATAPLSTCCLGKF